MSCGSLRLVRDPMRINPVRVVEEVVILGVDLNILPSAVFPSTWYKMHSWLSI